MAEKWKMPKWMESYRWSIRNTGGNSIEDCMNGNADPRVNLPLSTIQFGVKSQVGLLYELKKAGKLPLKNCIPFCSRCGYRVTQAAEESC